MATTTVAEQHDKSVEPELDDIEAYVATFDDEERAELAGAAIDIAILLHRAREYRGLGQAAAAELAGLQQQAVSRFERPGVSPHLETLHSYLGALGYALELKAIDVATGKVIAKVLIPPKSLSAERPPRHQSAARAVERGRPGASGRSRSMSEFVKSR